MSVFLRVARSVLAVVAGFAVITIGTVLTFEVLLGGIGFHKSSPGVLALATLGAFLSGLLGGVVAARLAAARPLVHATAVLLPIALDTTSIVVKGTSADPVWFDLAGSSVLAGAAVLGGLLVKLSRDRR